MPSDPHQNRMEGWQSCILILIALFLLPARADAVNILVLNSYHEGFEWTDDIVHGAADVLKSTRQKIAIHTEYMDTRRHPGRPFLDTLAAYYKVKYAKVHFSSIIASDDTAV